VLGRAFIDMYPLEAEDFIKKVIAMDWDRLILGHPSVDGRLGTPNFVAKVEDIVGHYIGPPDKALVLAVDEKRPLGRLSPPRPLTAVAS
jgi:hypothetical protein